MPMVSLSTEEAVLHLDQLRDPQQRFVYLVERAKNRDPLPERYRVDAHRVVGCQVRTWWVGEMRSGACWFGLDSDAVTVKALGGFLCEQANALSWSELMTYQGEPLERWGLLRQLADNRRATLLRLSEKIRTFARNEASRISIP